MSDVIERVLEMRVRNDQAEKLRRLLDGTANVTCKQEPGALLFEYEVDAKETRGTVADRHVGNDAMLSHPPMDDPASPEPVAMDAEYHRMLAGFQR